MEMFSQNELLLMIGVVSVLLICISILTILDIKEYLKNKKVNILEEVEEELVPEQVLVQEEKKEDSIEVFEVKDEEIKSNIQEDEMLYEVSEEPIKIEEVEEEPLITEIGIEPIKKEQLSVQVNEVKEKINLEEELNKAAEPVNSLEDTITNFEMEQERTAIISLDELMKKTDDLYNGNEIMQYDDGNEPISIDEVMNRYNESQERIVPEVMESIIEDVPDEKELYSHKQTTPFISSIYGLEPENNALAFENTATYEKLDRVSNNEFMNKLREMSENKLGR